MKHQTDLFDHLYPRFLFPKDQPIRVVELRNTAYWIRKLIPRETGRLMGMNDEQINRQLATVSNSQAYKQDGNGIVAQVIALIVGMMYYEDETELRRIVMGNSHIWRKGESHEIQT